MKSAVIFVLCAVSVGTIYSQLQLPTDITSASIGECVLLIECEGCFAPVCGLAVINTTNTSAGYWCFSNQECFDTFNATCGQHGAVSVYPANMSSCSSVNSTCAAKKAALQCNTTTTTTKTY